MIRLYQVFVYLKLQHLQDLHQQVITLQMADNSTFLAVLPKGGTSIQTVGEQVAQSSSMRLVLEILPISVPQEQALLRMSPRMLSIGRLGLTPLPLVVTWTSLPATLARRMLAVVRTEPWCVRPQNSRKCIKKTLTF